MILIKLSICCLLLVFEAVDPSSSTAALQKRRGNPCSTVSCYFNSMCVMDPSTDEPVCICPEDECDGVPAPVCAEGITFKSPCHAQTHMCKAQKWITIQHAGACGDQACSPSTPCPFFGRCVLGVCSCVRCRDVDSRWELDLRRSRRTSVCGSDGVTYESECDLRYQACSSRSHIVVVKLSPCHIRRKFPVQRNVPVRSLDNHFLVWRQMDPLEEGREYSKGEVDVEFYTDPEKNSDVCSQFELRGCLPAGHRRLPFLGIYTLIPGKRQVGSPVYEKVIFKGSKKTIYLSRYNSTRFENGTWIVGSKVGSGIGWLGVNDPSNLPQDITSTWQSTTGSHDKPWVPEPVLSGRCFRSEERKPPACELGQERGPLGINWQSATQQTPLYQLDIKRPFRTKFYRPGKKLIVEVSTNNRARRFLSVYVSMENDIDTCEVPHLSRHRNKFDISCEGSVISKSNGKRMKRVLMHFRAPPRGCVTFRALVKSITGEIFYDDNPKSSLAPAYLTKTICHVGHSTSKL